MSFYQSTVSRHFHNQCGVKSSDSSVNCVDYNQLCVVSCPVCDKGNNEVIFNNIHKLLTVVMFVNVFITKKHSILCFMRVFQMIQFLTFCTR